MKITSQARFPHPVLAAGTGDYKSGEFSVSFEVAENPEEGRVTVNCTVALTEPDLLELVTNASARLGIFVTCRETYYNQLIPLGLEGGPLAFERGALLGRVAVRPVVWSCKQISGYSLANCHDEYGGGTTDFAAGSVLALGQELVISVGREKLAQMETIFTIVKTEALPPGMLSVDLEGEKVRVLVASDSYDTVNNLRGLVHGRPIILNSVYLPAVMQVLDSLRDGKDQFEGKRWFRVIDAKCIHLGIDTTAPDLWMDAQKLLRSPFLEINNSREIVGA